MSLSPEILKELERGNFQVSTDTRAGVQGKVFFALNGENFDGSTFAHEAIKKGALAVITENSEIKGEKIYLVESVLQTLQQSAQAYRKSFSIPIVAIGGSNGKTTTRELVREVLQTKYKVHSSKENLNNHIGLPLSILSMNRETELGVFEIGANHPGEHLDLLEILSPTHVLVTNNGLDHLEGFGSPEGARLANKEIYDWAKKNKTKAFINKIHPDLVEDSEGLDERILYPKDSFEVLGAMPLELKFKDNIYRTQMSGEYNLDNIYTATALGDFWGIKTEESLIAVSSYIPTLKRSQFVRVGEMDVILDCYNANPSSMKLSLESFLNFSQEPRGVVLGDMFELGEYSEKEHEKIVNFLNSQKIDCVVLVGLEFGKISSIKDSNYHWFSDSDKAREWFEKQQFDGCTFLLKGSRGVKVENVLGL